MKNVTSLLSLLLLGALTLGLLGQGVTREIPLGSARGQVIMSENNKPLAGAWVRLVPMISEFGGEPVRPFQTKTNPEGRFSIGSLPTGPYMVEVIAKYHDARRTQIVVQEGEFAEKQIQATPTIPFLDFYTSQHVFTPDEQPEITLNGLEPSPAATFRVYKVSITKIIQTGNLASALTPLANATNKQANITEDLGKLVRDEQIDVSQRDGEGVFTKVLKLETLPQGVYWMTVQMGKESRGAYLNITPHVLVVKSDGKKAHTWLTEAKSGQPISGAKIATIEGVRREVGATDPSGYLAVNLKDPGEDSESNVLIIAEKDGATSLSTAYAETNRPEFRSFLKTDRPIYRPGDQVQWKTTFRQVTPAGLKLPSQTSAEIIYSDPNNAEIARSSASINPDGSISGEFKTLKDLPGTYQFEIKAWGQTFSQYVSVASYRKPEFQIKVTPIKKITIAKEAVQMKVVCENYFGAPVPQAKINAKIFRRPRYAQQYEGEWSEEVDPEAFDSYQGELVGDAQATTNDKGEATLEFQPKQEDQFQDWTYTFEVEATATGEKYFTGKGQAITAQAEVALLIDSTDSWATPGATVQVKLITQSTGDEKPAPNQTIKAKISKELWDGKASTAMLVATQETQSDADGIATLSWTPQEEGSYTVELTTQDAKGNETKTRQYIYAWNDGSNPQKPLPKLAVSLKKQNLTPGATAEAVIESGQGVGSVWVTLESDQLTYQKVVQMKGPTTSISIPLDPAISRNATLAVTAVKDKSVLQSQTQVLVTTKPRRLKVDVKARQKKVLPGGVVEFDIQTQDGEKPVSAAVSFSLVDEAIYAVRSDNQDPIADLYQWGWNHVRTNSSVDTLYLDGGDKGGGNVQIRQNFQDTAFWQADVRTDASGRATVRITLPDNVTSWRGTACAITDDSQAGVGTGNVIAEKPLMVILSPRAYWVMGDEQDLVASVHNHLGKDASATVTLESAEFEVQNAEQTFTFGDGDVKTVRWKVRPKKPGLATFQAIVRAAGASDGMKISIPVYTFGVQKTVGGSSRSFTFVREPGATEGMLKIHFSPTLGGDILGSLDTLIDYPYGCVEQTMSRFLPALIAADASRKLNIPITGLEKKLPEVTAQSINRLISMRQSDGGWGWFSNDTSDPGMTGLVLEGLVRARRLGERVPDFMENGAREFAKKWFSLSTDNKVTEADAKLAMAWAFSQPGPEASAALAWCRKGTLNTLGWSYVALGMHELGEPLDEVVAKIKSGLTEGAESVSINRELQKWDEVEAMARILQLATRAKTSNVVVIPHAIQWIQNQRQGGGWVSTKDTAQVLIGLTDYMLETRELNQSGTATILRDGKELGRLDFTPENVLTTNLQLQLPLTDLPEGSSAFEIKTTGSPGYVHWEARQVRPQKTVAAESNGFTVTRTFHGLESVRQADGSYLLRSGPAATRFKSGDPVRCMVRVDSERAQSHVLVKVPIPTNMACQESEQAESWYFWFNGMQILDDHIAFFTTALPKGQSIFEFNLRAEAPGTSKALPALTQAMYEPTLAGNSAGAEVTVIP